MSSASLRFCMICRAIAGTRAPAQLACQVRALQNSWRHWKIERCAVGLEARCKCTWGDRTETVRAHLDSTGLAIAGPIRMQVDLAKIKAVEASKGHLRLRTSEGAIALELGDQAGKWAQLIKYPRSRIEKLGIKPGQRVLLVGLDEPELEAELESRDCVIVRRETKTPVDAVMVLIDEPDKLPLIARYRKAISADGALWVIRPKGKNTPVTEAQARAAALRAELVDVKVVSFSDTLTAEKMVIPRAKR